MLVSFLGFGANGSVEANDGVEWFMESVVGDALAFDVDLREDGLVDEASALVVASQVEAPGVVEEIEGGVEQRCACFESFFGAVEDGLVFCSLGRDVLQSLFGLGGWQVEVSPV